MLYIAQKKVALNSPAWLASSHGVENAQTFLFDPADYADIVKIYGGIPSGYPVKIEDGKAKPISDTTAPEGFVLWDQSGKGGQTAVAILVHGIIQTNALPKLVNGASQSDFTKPATPGLFRYL